MQLTSEEVNYNQFIASLFKTGVKVVLRELTQVWKAAGVCLCTYVSACDSG